MPAHDIMLPGVPLIESPLFDRELEQMALSAEEREIAIKLNRDGYAVFDFPDADIEERINRIRTEFAPIFGIDEHDRESSKHGGVGRVQDAWKSNADVRAIAANAQVIDLLSRLYGRTAFPFQTLNFPVGTQQHFHTDAVHFSSVPPRFMCGVWLAMEDIDADSGPLCYVPGSHKWPMLDNAMIGRRGHGSQLDSAQSPFEQLWRAMIETHQAPVEHFCPRKGQALIWTANLLHGGSARQDMRRTRWSQVTHYYFDDCVYYTPAFSDEYLGQLALRSIVSAADGTSKPNRYLGQKIAAPEPALGGVKRTIARWQKKSRRILKGK